MTAFLFAKSLVAQMACSGKRCSAFASRLCLLPFYVCKTRKTTLAYGHLWRVWMSFRCQNPMRFWMSFRSRGISISDKFSVKMQTSWERRLNNLLFSNFVLLFAGSKKKGNPCGREVSTDVSSQHLCLLQVVSVLKMSWFGCRLRCRSGCRSLPTWNTPKTVETQN